MFEYCDCDCGCGALLVFEEVEIGECTDCEDGWHVDTYDETLDEIEFGGEG